MSNLTVTETATGATIRDGRAIVARFRAGRMLLELVGVAELAGHTSSVAMRDMSGALAYVAERLELVGPDTAARATPYVLELEGRAADIRRGAHALGRVDGVPDDVFAGIRSALEKIAGQIAEQRAL